MNSKNYISHNNDMQSFILNDYKEKNQKIQTVFVRMSPIMEVLTGIMIAILIYYSGILIVQGELDINNFFSFLAAMMLAYQPIRSLATINMTAYQGAAAFKRISNVIDKDISIKENKNFKVIGEILRYKDLYIFSSLIKRDFLDKFSSKNPSAVII